MLIQFSTKTTKVLYFGQVEENEAFPYEVKVMPRHDETSQSAFFHKDNMSETEREDTVAKIPRTIALGEHARTATLKYRSVITSIYQPTMHV